MDDALHLEPDPPRPAPHRRAARGRATAIGALAVFASFAGGFVAGYAVDGGGGGGGAEVAVLGGEGGDDGSTTEVVSPPETTIASAGTSNGVALDGPYAEPVRSRVFRRDTASGLSVRVHRSDLPGGFPCGNDTGWCPPPQCNPTSSIEAMVVGEWEVAHGAGPLFELQDGSPARVLGFVTSWVPAEATFGVIVRAADDVDAVRLTSGGATDEMAPIGGLAVVAVPDAAFDATMGAAPLGARLEIVRGAATTEVSLGDAFVSSPECVPPPPAPPLLPAPGTQPDDAAAADAAVRERFFAVFGQADGASLDEGVDDATGLAALRDELRERYPEMIGAVTYEMGDLVFTSPTEATYHFRPIVPNSGAFTFQIGGARLIEGEWKLTRATVCAMFGLGGASC